MRGESSPNRDSAVLERDCLAWSYDMFGKPQIGLAMLGTPEAHWYLENEAQTIFYEGMLTVTLKPYDRKGNRYWYAFKFWSGKTYKVYVGKSERITGEHLDEVCEKMYQKLGTN